MLVQPMSQKLWYSRMDRRWMYLETIVDIKIWFEMESPQGQEIIKESRNIQTSRLTKLPARSGWRHHSKGMDPIRHKRQDIKREGTSDSIERKDWSPSYPKLGSSFFFSKFWDRSCLTRTHSQASAINTTPTIVIDISHRSTKTSIFTFQLRPPLRSRSRVDFDEFFVQAELHQMTWPLAWLWVSVMTYIVTYKSTTDDWSLASRSIS